MKVEIPQDIIERAATFTGDGRQLEAALGAYVLGRLYGYRALQMMHTFTTCRRHEEILGSKMADLFEPTTERTGRLVGIQIAEEVGSFWNVARGKLANSRQRTLLQDQQMDLL